MIFDSEMASLAATRASEEQIIRLEENLSRHKLYKDNPQKAAECDMEFHYLIAEATGNDFLAQIYTVLKEILQYALYDIVKVMGTKNAYIYHSNIIQAIRNKDVWGARECMRAHILDTIAASEGSENKAEEAQGKPAL